uniref:Large ribosomal subunit protein uL1c n=1 Tax=Calliarthron tuberculosum TaxID=48942 RepID=M4IUX2_CALTB|nr:50S ribosomal protein L1 [Calliarthron tuberculosum]AGA63794.1 50S ribosomal protein L1 [Calliarthron tuberculosum]
MSKSSRRYRQLLQKINKTCYSPLDAIDLLYEVSNANFIETADIHILLGLDPKYADQQLRSTVTLPKGTGKKIRVAVIANGEQVAEAIEAGADIVGYEDLIDEIAKGRLDFDKLIATPIVMPLIAKLGRLLGPRGLMPSPKAGTVTNNLSESIAEFKAGKLEYRVDRTGIIHVPFGKVNFSRNDLLANLIAIKDSVEKNRPSGSRGKYWKSVYISSTMSPSISIDINLLREQV